jgi:hypothetical protein
VAPRRADEEGVGLIISHRISGDPGRISRIREDGKLRCKTGEYLWRPATKDAVENVGTTEVKAVIVKLKHAAPAAPMKNDVAASSRAD